MKNEEAGTDLSEEHDPFGQNLEENEAEDEITEEVVGEDPVQDAEDAAVNIDTEVAKEATKKTAETDEDKAVEKAVEADVTAIEELEKKHKNRESTSEKAKKAAANREKKGLAAEPQKQLDPLRLRGKKYRAVIGMIDPAKAYELEEAIALVQKTNVAKFDAAVELHAKVKNEVRGTVSLPHGTGKTRKVAVADDATIEAIAAGKLDFDVLLATPAQMPKLAKYAKILGPKGLMPSPKSGTVTEDLESAKKEIGGGRIEYRSDKNGVVHLSIGRISFKPQELKENLETIQQILQSAKILSLSLASTMGPGVKVLLTD